MAEGEGIQVTFLDQTGDGERLFGLLMNEIAALVAVAVEQQRAATHDIAQSVHGMDSMVDAAISGASVGWQCTSTRPS